MALTQYHRVLSGITLFRDTGQTFHCGLLQPTPAQMKFFGGRSSKKPSFKKHSSSNTFPSHFDEREDSHHPRSEPSSPSKSPTKSPKKTSSSRPSSHIDSPKSSRPSRSSRHTNDSGSSSSSRRSKFDPDTHPLNLPPEERRRLSSLAQSAMSGSNSMDIDREPPVNGASPGSPQNPSAQANFSVPIPNGTSPGEAPAPPPHKSNPSSPVTTPQGDAEDYKAAGNRHFKEKNYAKAIEQYNKGML